MTTVATACALCGEHRCEPLHLLRDRLYRTTGAVFPLVRCTACGLARLNPRPADLTPHYPPRYWHRGTALSNLYRRLVLRDHLRFALHALAGRALPVPGRALDVGCGSGLFSRLLRQASRGAVLAFGLDASPRAASAAALNHVPALVADLTRAPFAPASWDLITMFHVLEHLPDPAATLDAARLLLAPNGRLIVQVPNLDSWQYRIMRSRWIGLDAPRHLHDFRLRDLRRLLEARGFRIARTKHFSWRDNAAAFATSLAPALDPVASARGLFPNLLYAALVAACLPFAALEAAFHRGATVMVEATPVP